MDHGYKSSSKADCKEINGKSGVERLAKSKTLKLKAGEYISASRIRTCRTPSATGLEATAWSIVQNCRVRPVVV